MKERYKGLFAVMMLAVSLGLVSCTGNTDEATKAPDTEEHGTIDQQIDSARNDAGTNNPGVQPVDTPETVGP